MNILILSCGIRNKIVQYFKKELGDKGLVIAADFSELAPALYDADKYYTVPKVNEEGYFEKIISICRDNSVKAIISLIDPELSMLAYYKKELLELGTVPIVSDYEIVELCLDKYAMHEFLINKGFKTVRSYVDKDIFYKDVESGIINYPVFVKPVKGSASININKVISKEEVEFLFNKQDNLMIQEFMDGSEYGVDVYIDLISGEIVSIFAKEKIKMRAGETDKSVSIKDESLFALIRSFVKKTGLIGVLDIDIFKVNGHYYISEVNPRFGGGYPHAYECGVNIPRMIINNICGKINNELIGAYQDNVYMMKYNEVKIKSKITYKI